MTNTSKPIAAPPPPPDERITPTTIRGNYPSRDRITDAGSERYGKDDAPVLGWWYLVIVLIVVIVGANVMIGVIFGGVMAVLANMMFILGAMLTQAHRYATRDIE